jgi:hypothetical protein
MFDHIDAYLRIFKELAQRPPEQSQARQPRQRNLEVRRAPARQVQGLRVPERHPADHRHPAPGVRAAGKWREAKAAEVLAKRPKLTKKELAKLVKGWNSTPSSPVLQQDRLDAAQGLRRRPHAVEENFRAYINGFSKNVDDIIEHFNYRATIGQMVKNNRLAPILNQYKELPLGPDKLSGSGDGLHLRGAAAALLGAKRRRGRGTLHPARSDPPDGRAAGHPDPDRHISIYDPACGTGGMLSVAKEHLLDRAATPERARQRRESSSPSTARSCRPPTTPSARPTC